MGVECHLLGRVRLRFWNRQISLMGRIQESGVQRRKDELREGQDGSQTQCLAAPATSEGHLGQQTARGKLFNCVSVPANLSPKSFPKTVMSFLCAKMQGKPETCWHWSWHLESARMLSKFWTLCFFLSRFPARWGRIQGQPTGCVRSRQLFHLNWSRRIGLCRNRSSLFQPLDRSESLPMLCPFRCR